MLTCAGSIHGNDGRSHSVGQSSDLLQFIRDIGIRNNRAVKIPIGYMPENTKLKSAVAAQKFNATQKAIKDFYNLLDELEITKAETRRRKVYNTDYETAKKLIQQTFLD